MKAAEVRSFPSEELRARIYEMKEELFNLRFQLATGQLDNYKRVGVVKREIATITTILRERDLGIEIAPKEESPKPRRIRRRRREEPSAEPEDENDGEDVAGSESLLDGTTGEGEES